MTQVLIVDDKEENLYMLRALLQGNGCEVTEARHGADALERARQTPPELVISDLLMPVMDGYTLLRHWKADEQLKRIPFIVYTATYTEPKDERLALDLGADAFILKPAEPRVLMTRFREVLAQARRNALPPARQPIGDDKALMDGYGEVLGRKLEETIAERKQAEAEVRHLATFPRFNPRPVLEFSATGEPVYLNQAAQALVRGEDGSLDPARALPPEARQIVLNCLASGRAREFVETKLGERVLEWSFYPIAELQVVHCYVDDITARLRLEDQLRQSQKMDAIGQLAAGVAHDFNNLLTVVQFEASLLEEMECLDPTAREAVGQIATAVVRAAALTRQLLVFSRKQERELRRLDLAELVTNMVRMFQRMLGEDIALGLRAAPGLSPLQADPGMIEQVIMNLVVNSRDALPEGGRIDLEIRPVEIGPAELASHPGGRLGRFVALAIADTGTGIAPENLGKIFEPFFTTKAPGKGTGLGLATVFGIVRQHEGWIEVASTVGRGTTIQVYLPVAPQEISTPAQATYPTPVRGGDETILVVEDEEAIRHLLQLSLERHGYRVIVAGSGAEALDRLAAAGGRIDLLVTDLVMPGGMNGRDLARRLQALFANLIVIYVSGYTSEVITRDLRLEPGVNFLRKPFPLEVIGGLVRRRLDEAAARLKAE